MKIPDWCPFDEMEEKTVLSFLVALEDCLIGQKLR